MKIEWSDHLPSMPGAYIVQWSLTKDLEIIYIVCDETMEDGLRNVNGARTHFSNWKCKWSEKILGLY